MRDNNEGAGQQMANADGVENPGHVPVTGDPLGHMGKGGLLLAVALVIVTAGCGRSAPDEAAPDAVSVLEETTLREPTTTTTPPPPTQVTYIIQSGDSLSVIAERFGVPTAVLAEFNAIGDVNTITVGQEIRIPPVEQATSSEPSTTTTS